MTHMTLIRSLLRRSPARTGRGRRAGRPRAPPCACAGKITAPAFDADLRYLSSDLLEGRAPATRGGQLAAQYIAAQLEIAGVQPGVDGSYFQKVPIDVVGAIPSSIRLAASGKASGTLAYPSQVVVWAGSASDSSIARGELVFAGYGVEAPEYKWDDFKGEDLKGKVLLVLVNDPPATAKEPKLFGGKAMTYYGRWTYKFEEAERRGAVGALIIHTDATAGYPWHTVVGSWAKEQRMLPRDPALPAPLGVRGWITDSAATALLAQAGIDLAAPAHAGGLARLQAGAHRASRLDLTFANKVAHLESENVVGVVKGSDAKLRSQYVVYSAHWDHLGIGPAVNGDSIYNGALDNASGTAALLAIARAAAKLAAHAALAAVRLRHRRGIGVARLGVVRAAPDGAGEADRRRPEHGRRHAARPRARPHRARREQERARADARASRGDEGPAHHAGAPSGGRALLPLGPLLLRAGGDPRDLDRRRDGLRRACRRGGGRSSRTSTPRTSTTSRRTSTVRTSTCAARCSSPVSS